MRSIETATVPASSASTSCIVGFGTTDEVARKRSAIFLAYFALSERLLLAAQVIANNLERADKREKQQPPQATPMTG